MPASKLNRRFNRLPTEFGMSARLIDRKSGQKLADVLSDIL